MSDSPMPSFRKVWHAPPIEVHHDLEVRGVRLRDVFRDPQGDLWEVISLVTEPQASFRRIRDDVQVDHVIGCRNMLEQFPNGSLRETNAYHGRPIVDVQRDLEAQADAERRKCDREWAWDTPATLSPPSSGGEQ